MRQFFFCFVFFLGLFCVIDVLALEGQNSADAWQQLQRIGQKFSTQSMIRSDRFGVERSPFAPVIFSA